MIEAAVPYSDYRGSQRGSGRRDQSAGCGVREGGTTADLALLELATENAELCLQLAEAQDQLIEMAVDAGELQALIEGLQAELAEAQAERDA